MAIFFSRFTMPETILVTGATSFIAGHIIKLLLEKDYNIRGTVRSQEKEALVLETIPENLRHRLSFVHVADIAVDSFDEAVQGVHGIIHVASQFHFKVTNPEKDLLLPAINGTESVLKAAHKYNTTHNDETNRIKRIVITSSFAAVVDGDKGLRPGYVYTEKDWSPLTYEEAATTTDNPAKVYRASKTLAEKAAWDFIEKQQPKFTIATICEPMVFGPRADNLKSLKDLNTSNAGIWTLVTSGSDATIPASRMPWEIDVRDVAFAHVAALEHQTKTNERYVIAAQSYSNQEIIDIVHASTKIPSNIKDNAPRGIPGQRMEDHYQIDSTKAQKELGVNYIPLKTSIEDLILQLVDVQNRSQ
jgi:nucleoside-diphosphate-sugar epimerase